MNRSHKKLDLNDLIIKNPRLLDIKTRWLPKFLVLFSLISMSLAFLAHYLLVTRTYPPSYVVNYSTFKVSKVPRLNNPSISNEAVIRWSSQAVSDIFKFNFVNIDTHLVRIQDYFSQEGYKLFINVLNETGLKQDVLTDKLALTAVSCEKLNIKDMIDFFVDGEKKTLWLLEIPMLLQIQSAGKPKLIRYLVTAMIESGSDIKVDKSIALVGIRMQQATVNTPFCRLK